MKTTKYRLPRDMTLTVSEKPKNLTIEKIGLPRESTYHVSMSGFDVYTPENIRYYISYSPDASCSYPVSLTEYSSIFPQEIVPMTRDGQRMDMRIRFDIDHEKPYVCLIGSVNGIYSVLEDRPLTTFTITPSTLDMLSPEYDMQSRIEFRFSHPFYEDQGSPNSPEYLAHREDEKL